MATITVNGQDVQIGDDERLNLIQAADRAGVPIPFYCWHPGLSVVASCRMCLVETGSKNKETGEVTMVPKLVPACQTPAKDGTVVVTNSEKVRANQQFVQEGILLDHPVDCPICDQAGECWLQDYYFQYGHKQRRADIRPFTSEKRQLGEHVTLFADRCVMCSRCVRFDREVSGAATLQVVNRGSHAEIDVFPGFPIDHPLSGNVNDLCPVGALCSTDFLYQQRVWFLEPHDSICTRCSTGCATQVQENHGEVYRIQPRYNPNANDWWMCDLGRYQHEYINAPERLRALQQRTGTQWGDVSWAQGLSAIDGSLRTRIQARGGRAVAFVLSPFLTCEEGYLLAKYARSLAPDVLLVLGHVPTVGEDQKFASGFTIRKERCPNRRGIEAILQQFQGSVIDWTALTRQAAAGEIAAAYITGNSSEVWNDEAVAAHFEKLDLLVVQDLLPSPLARKAHYVVPGASFAEKAGCYVNHAGLIQTTDWAIRPREGVHSDGQTFGDLLGRSGLYNAADVLRELAAAIPFFSRAANGVPPAGLNLATGAEKQPQTTALGTVTHPLPTFRSVGSPLVEIET